MTNLPDDEKSLWRDFYTAPVYQKFRGELEVDTVIIGGGITGLTSAYLLKQSGLKVAVIEKDTIGGGTTGRTTGKVTSQHGLTYSDLQKRLGKDTARIYGEAGQAALGMVEQIIRTEKIDCDWQREDNYVFTADPRQVEQFQAEASTAASLGLPASFETTAPLPFEISGAVKFASQGKFNSQKYLLGLAKAVHGDGSFVFEFSNVVGIQDGNPARIKANKGKITARDIIVATNVPTLPLMARGGYCILEYPTESFIVAGRPGKEIKGMYISPDKDHFSILPVTVNGEPMILVGGAGGNLPGLNFSKMQRYQRLANYAQQHFGVSTISHHWSDRDYIAYDNVPLIGKLYPWSKHLYVGSAYRKWGLSSGTLAGMILRDLITGEKNPWANVFTPNRIKPITSIPRAIVQYLKS